MKRSICYKFLLKMKFSSAIHSNFFSKFISYRISTGFSSRFIQIVVSSLKIWNNLFILCYLIYREILNSSKFKILSLTWKMAKTQLIMWIIIVIRRTPLVFFFNAPHAGLKRFVYKNIDLILFNAKYRMYFNTYQEHTNAYAIS